MPAPRPKQWTTKALLAWMTGAFEDAGLDSPRLSAELLLSHVLGCERLRLYMEADRPASEIERSALRDLVRRALDHEPVQYLVGEWSFFGLAMTTDARALVPRPSTETVVEAVLEHCKSTPGFGGASRETAGDGVFVVDVCTGSGAIACAIAKELPASRLLATDVSEEALGLAAENVGRHGLGDRVELAPGDLLAPVLEHPVAGRRAELHALVSNPPYVSDAEWEALPANVKDHEPAVALRGGRDGLDLVRPILEDAPELLRPSGLLAIEVAASHAARVLELAQGDDRLRGARIVRDFEGLDRTLVAERAG
ncbi:MAG: peptide chain release factor N(5)-glutamine methyltransferase [Planctomycetota bacterium]